MSTNSFECSHFGVPEPSFPVAEELKQDIAVNEAMWQIYEEFSNGLEELAKEDWISFRYYQLSSPPADLSKGLGNFQFKFDVSDIAEGGKPENLDNNS